MTHKIFHKCGYKNSLEKLHLHSHKQIYSVAWHECTSRHNLSDGVFTFCRSSIIQYIILPTCLYIRLNAKPRQFANNVARDHVADGHKRK